MLATGTVECLSQILWVWFLACETNGNPGKNGTRLALMSRAWTDGGKLLISTCAKHGRGDMAEGLPDFPEYKLYSFSDTFESRLLKITIII